MFRLPIHESENEFRKYFTEIAEKFCPFLRPGIACSGVLLTDYPMPVQDAWSKRIFCSGLVHAELLRLERKKETSNSNKIFLCENVFFDFGATTPEENEKIFSWPHWLLKILYLEVGVVFGKFWVGEIARSGKGELIPAPPKSFLSIRSVVKLRDERFVNNYQELIETMRLAEDDDRNCLDKLGRSSISEIGLEIVSLIKSQSSPTQDSLQKIIERIEGTSLYEESLVWGQEQLAKLSI